MRAGDSQKKRSFSNRNKTNPMMNDNELQSKAVYGLFGN